MGLRPGLMCCFACGLLVVAGAEVGAAASWPELTSPAPTQGGGERDAALIVGIEDYAFVPDVPGARQNVSDWALHLTRTRQIPAERVLVLRDLEATREAILDAAHKAAQMVSEGGVLWFVYVGHGAPGDQGQALLVGSDAQGTASSLKARGVSHSDLARILRSGPAHRAVALLDACFSGQTPSGTPLVEGLQPLVPVKDAVDGVTLLSAGASDQFAGPLPGTARPAFSYLALGALRGWGDTDRDGVVTPREVIRYTRDALRVLNPARAQTPQLEGPHQDAPLATRAGEAPPDLMDIVLGDSRPDERPPSAEASPPRDWHKPKALGRGLVKLGLGVTRLDPGALNLTTFDTEVSHKSDTIFTSFPLDLGGVSEGVDPMTLTGQATWGQQGATLNLNVSLAWADKLKIKNTVSTVEDGFSQGVDDLVQGTEGTITDFFTAQLTAEAGYRLRLAMFNLFVQGGLGVGISRMTNTFEIDGVSNEVGASGFDVILPVRAGIDVDLFDELFAHASVTLFVLPTSSDAFQAGLGIYF